MIDLIDQAVHDVIEQRHLLVVEMPRARNKQVSCLTQDFAREPIFRCDIDASTHQSAS
jgi:hypothetical protein